MFLVLFKKLVWCKFISKSDWNKDFVISQQYMLKTSAGTIFLFYNNLPNKMPDSLDRSS